MPVGDGLALAIAVVVALPWLTLAVESFASLLPRRRSRGDGERPACVVLIPAHDEAGGIAATVANVRAQCGPGDRILVVADNCTDDTALRAREAGAEAVERSDAERRGKGFALDFGIKSVAADPPAVLVVVDADCELAPDALDHLVRQAHGTGRPAQGIYLIGTGTETELKRRLSAFAVVIKNQVRPLGLDRLGQPVLLTGTGMAFPWPAIAAMDLGSGNIVEDMKLGVDLTIAGHPPRLCPDARLSGAAAPDRGAAIKQRTRWEHGHVQTIATQVPRLLASLVGRPRMGQLSMAMEVGVPPLSLLLFASLMIWAGCLIWWQWAGGWWAPAAVLAGAIYLAGAGLGLSWFKFARTMLPLTSLVATPGYILWKLPIYLKLPFSREKRWVRTERRP